MNRSELGEEWTAEDYAALKREVAYAINQGYRRFPWMDHASIESAAWLGAVKAHRAYRPGESKLASYASHRIRGQIQDDAKTLWRFHGRTLELPEVACRRFITVPASTAAIEAQLSVAALLRRVSLHPRQAEAIRLRYLDELTHREIAALFHVTESRVYSLLKSAKDKLSRAARRHTPLNGPAE